MPKHEKRELRTKIAAPGVRPLKEWAASARERGAIRTRTRWVGMGPGERLTIGDGGWVFYDDARFSGRIYLRFNEQAGRLEVADLYIAADDGLIEAEDLRRIPLGRIVAAANDPRIADSIRRSIGEGDESTEKRIRKLLRDASREGEKLAENRKAERRKPRLKLRVPTGNRKPDAFYQRVADAYAWLGHISTRPAAELADINELPVTTVHRWIKEARRRGFLPPGQRGASTQEER